MVHKGNERLAKIDCRLDQLQAQRDGKEAQPFCASRGRGSDYGPSCHRACCRCCGWNIYRVGRDRWPNTSPLFLLVMFFLGAIAGMLNVWRVFTGRGLAAGYFDEHKNSSLKDE